MYVPLGHHLVTTLSKMRNQRSQLDGTLHTNRKKWLALAQVVLKDAPIWILDEPTEGLDDATAQALMRTLAGLIGARALLFITHDITLVDPLAITQDLTVAAGVIAE